MQMVYVGYSTLDDGKPGAVLVRLKPGDVEGAEFSTDDRIVFPRKAMTPAVIGAIYEMEQVSETSFKLANRKYLRMFASAWRVAQWQLDAKSRQIREETNKLEKKAGAEIAALELMEPLRKIYKTAMPDRRRVIETLLLDYLRRP